MARVWWTAIRSRTLSLAISPVLVGTALAWSDGIALHWPALLAAMACALLIQIGTNLHNDVVDFERGNDRPDRIGPLRVTAAGWVSPRTMHRATASTFGLAALLGLYLVTLGGWVILLAGVASLLARPRCGERLLAPGSRVGEEPRWRSRRCCEMSDGWLRLRAAPRV